MGVLNSLRGYRILNKYRIDTGLIELRDLILLELSCTQVEIAPN